VVQELFPDQLWLRVEADGKLWMELRADIGSLIPLFDMDVSAMFPLVEAQVGNSMVAGVGFEPTTFGL
jgi:hypothetical protein